MELSSLAPQNPNEQDTDMQLVRGPDGTPVFKSAKESPKISNVLQFMRLMLIYGVPYLTAHPLRGPEYLQYLSTILNADLKYNWTAVLQYDIDFRRHRQNNPQHSWAEMVTDLKTDLQASHNLKPKNISSFRGQHQPHRHDGTQFPICENFNKGICFKRDCRYRYVCKICKKP